MGGAVERKDTPTPGARLRMAPGVGHMHTYMCHFTPLYMMLSFAVCLLLSPLPLPFRCFRQGAASCVHASEE